MEPETQELDLTAIRRYVAAAGLDQTERSRAARGSRGERLEAAVLQELAEVKAELARLSGEIRRSRSSSPQKDGAAPRSPGAESAPGRFVWAGLAPRAAPT